jgi:UDP-N-acetylmuramate dehydrogenase
MISFKNIQIDENVNLGALTTMQIGGGARYLTKVKTVEQIREALDFAKSENLPIFVLGSGSNTIVHDEGFAGLVIKNEILGREMVSEDAETKTFKIGAGEIWDEFCQWAVRDQQLSGCEAMVMIPGTVGALPVQNVGAYGQETVNIFAGCEALNLETGELEILSAEDCKLGYRSSIFREEALGKYFITSVKLRLFKQAQKVPLYFSVAEYFDQNQIDGETATPQQIMDAVIHLRSEKLPDPKDIPSAGSFFKNVEIPDVSARAFKLHHPSALIFPSERKGFSKIPAGWLIDQSGLRGKLIHGMRPHDKNALILTNISAKSYAELAAARTEIQQTVKAKFGFELEQEPLEI